MTVQCLELGPFTARTQGLSPSWKTKILQAGQRGQKQEYRDIMTLGFQLDPRTMKKLYWTFGDSCDGPMPSSTASQPSFPFATLAICKLPSVSCHLQGEDRLLRLVYKLVYKTCSLPTLQACLPGPLDLEGRPYFTEQWRQ